MNELLEFSEPGGRWIACDPDTERVVTPSSDPEDPATHDELRALLSRLREVEPRAVRILSVRLNVWGGDPGSQGFGVVA
ncbi:hypothetical protein [Streptomyces sp. NPDC048277]|uniref:hypothetical protein n=1 Tax=Streptomyces sp. NPDC048277 TaxID=3155027 RepID=UPI0033C808D2